jgi:hypothetical protein
VDLRDLMEEEKRVGEEEEIVTEAPEEREASATL